jgi:hypothetical protein
MSFAGLTAHGNPHILTDGVSWGDYRGTKNEGRQQYDAAKKFRIILFGHSDTDPHTDSRPMRGTIATHSPLTTVFICTYVQSRKVETCKNGLSQSADC